MNRPVCQLEEFFLNKLHLDFQAPASGQELVTQLRFSFDYDVGTHKTDANRYRLTLEVTCHEATAAGKKTGNAVEVEITGFFSFPDGTDRKKMNLLVRVNGVSILYGILRGIVANNTGTFPHGKFLLPTVMPQDIVKQIEEEKAAQRKPKAEEKPASRK